MTSTTLPRRIGLPFRTPPLVRSMLIGFAATLLLGLLGLVAASTAIGVTSQGTVLPGVSVGGVDLTGLGRDAARVRLVQDLPALDAGTATIVVDDAETVVAFADLGRGYEVESMLDAAFSVGRGAGLLTDGIDRLRALAHPTALPVIVHPYDPPSLDAVAISIATSATTHPVGARVVRGSWEVVPARDGRLLEPETVRGALAGPLASTSPDDLHLALSTTVVAPVVTTAEATRAAEAARAAVADLALTVPGAADGEEPLAVDAGTVASWIGFGPDGDAQYALRFAEPRVSAFLTTLAERVDRDPIDARFAVAGTGLGGVIAGTDGRILEIEASTDGIIGALAERAGGAEVAAFELDVTVTEPSLTTAEAEALLPQMRMVSSWTTNYVPGDGNGYGNNISIPAWDLDGTNLAPGQWFSFWGGIGPVTTDRGYRYGGAIINGRSVAQGALAGGICSTSTTLFNAAMRFGLEIGERENHYYFIDRYPTGLDATVAIVNESVVDMTFRNDTEYPIVIRGFGSPGKVTFQLWSVPNGRTVYLSDPVISDRKAAIETTQLDTSLAAGSSRRVEYPHDGFNVSVARTVYDASGAVVHQNTWYSDYRAVNGITLVGPTPPPPPEPPPDEDGGEEPPEEPTP